MREHPGFPTMGVMPSLHSPTTYAGASAASPVQDPLLHLAAIVAHDLNNITTSLLAYAQFLLEQIPATSPAHQDVVELQGVVEQAVRLTHRLQIFAKPPAQLRAVDVTRVVEEVVRRFKPGLAGGRVRMLPSPPGLIVLGEPRELAEALEDLITVAVANSAKGDVAIGTAERRVPEPLRHAGGTLPAGGYAVLTVSHPGQVPYATVMRLHDLHFGGPLCMGLVHGVLRHFGGHLVVETSAATTEYAMSFPARQARSPT